MPQTISNLQALYYRELLVAPFVLVPFMAALATALLPPLAARYFASIRLAVAPRARACMHLVSLGYLTGFLLVPIQTGSPLLDVCLLLSELFVAVFLLAKKTNG